MDSAAGNGAKKRRFTMVTTCCFAALAIGHGQAPTDRAAVLGLERSDFGQRPVRNYLKGQWEQMASVFLFPQGRSDVRYVIVEVIATPYYKPFLSKEKRAGKSIRVEWTIPLVHTDLYSGNAPVYHSAWRSPQEMNGTLGRFLVGAHLAPKTPPRSKPDADLRATGGLATYTLVGLDENGLKYSFVPPVTDDETRVLPLTGAPAGWPVTDFPYPMSERERKLLKSK
ncbi:MAG: hypothetical protein ACHQ50_07745 [Fimbriimonadales bacterium]